MLKRKRKLSTLGSSHTAALPPPGGKVCVTREAPGVVDQASDKREEESLAAQEGD